jgi:hypothetical protein
MNRNGLMLVWTKSALLVPCCVLATLCSFASPGWAATFIVDSTIDATDLAPGDGVCATATGQCTLRAAIQETNVLCGRDTILVPAGTYTLTISGAGDNVAAAGDLDITDDLEIIGESASSTIIDGNQLDIVFHVIAFTPAGLTHRFVTIRRLTIRNGLDLGVYHEAHIHASPGSGVGELVLQDVIVENNAGGGIHNGGTLVLLDSIVRSNTHLDNRSPTTAGASATSISIPTWRM